jgi:uridylate kinase
MSYKRILLKLSGESLSGDKNFGISASKISHYVKGIQSLLAQNIELAIVIGGGNIFRGIDAKEQGLDSTQGDYMGMLATVINGLALQASLEKSGIPTRVLSAIEINKIVEPYIRRRAIRHLEKGRVIIFVAGTGNPYFTTDTAATLRAIEINADVIAKGTRVDGVYTNDPETDKSATKIEKMSINEVYEKKLSVMDMTAYTLCKENKLPIIVFDINDLENLTKLAKGEKVGTLIEP